MKKGFEYDAFAEGSGTTLVRRRFSPNNRSSIVGGADRTPMREREAQMDNARFKVVL
jgi:hypothetical protein